MLYELITKRPKIRRLRRGSIQGRKKLTITAKTVKHGGSYAY